MRWLHGLLVILVLAAASVVAYIAVDRWTAVPWSGLPEAGWVAFKVQDATTGQPVVGARIRRMDGAVVVADMDTFMGEKRIHQLFPLRGTGYRSLVRDTRRVDLGDTDLLVTADGYEDLAVSERPLFARASPDGRSVDYVIKLRPAKGRADD